MYSRSPKSPRLSMERASICCSALIDLPGALQSSAILAIGLIMPPPATGRQGSPPKPSPGSPAHGRLGSGPARAQHQYGTHGPVVAPAASPGPCRADRDPWPGQDVVDVEQCREPPVVG